MAQAPLATDAPVKRRSKAASRGDEADMAPGSSPAAKKGSSSAKKKSVSAVAESQSQNGSSTANGYPATSPKDAASPALAQQSVATSTNGVEAFAEREKPVRQKRISSKSKGDSTEEKSGTSEKKLKKRASKHWANAAVDAEEAGSAEAIPDGPACKQFAIGEEVVVRIATVMREQESLESKELLQLRKGDHCRVTEHGVDESGRRLKVVGLESGQEGWISCVGRGTGNPIIKSASKPPQSELLQKDAAAASGLAAPKAPLIAAVAPKEPAAPTAPAVALAVPPAPKSIPAELGTQGRTYVDEPEAEESLQARPAAAHEVDTLAPGPMPPADVQSPCGSCPTQRMDLIEHLFQMLDQETSGRLNQGGLLAYAALCGFNDTEEQWAREYDALCKLYGWNAREGADVLQFAQLIDDEEGAAYCTDEELVSVLDEVHLYGVPRLSTAEDSRACATSPPPQNSTELDTASVSSPTSEASKNTGSRKNVVGAVTGVLSSLGRRSNKSASAPGKGIDKE